MKIRIYGRSTRNYWVLAIVIGLYLFAAVVQRSNAQQPRSLAAQFQAPPNSAKPMAYWWWLNGHTDSATITSYLEAMQRKGYSGANRDGCQWLRSGWKFTRDTRANLRWPCLEGSSSPHAEGS